MIAQSIHNASPRRAGPFVAVNCAAVPHELGDAEFFGYEPGAFTGAKRGGNAGRFEQAHCGSLFLDEISELSPRAQAGLLRALQEMEVVRLGSGKPRAVDVRVIAATNRDLKAEVEAGRFRPDLFYRLNVLAIAMPSLRERPQDITPLADTFVSQVPGRRGLVLSAAALEALVGYNWPGNVRELRAAISRAALLARGPVIGVDDLAPEIRDHSRAAAPAAWPKPREAADRTSAACEDPDRERVLLVLNQCSGNMTEAARRLGISRMTLYRWIRKWSLARTVTLASS